MEEADVKEFTAKEWELLEALAAQSVITVEKAGELLSLKKVSTLVNKLVRKGAVEVFEGVREKYKPRLETLLRLTDPYRDEAKMKSTLDQMEKKAFRQAEALLKYFTLCHSGHELDGGWIRKTELLKTCEAGALSGLVKKGVLEEKVVESGRLHHEKRHAAFKGLTADQSTCYGSVVKALEHDKPVLLHGVTGSGKTEIYIQLIRDALANNKQVLYLVPEIALTTQLITRLTAVFGEKVGLYHSRFSENERVEVWQNVLSQDDETTRSARDANRVNDIPYNVIVGARSSLFLPFSNLGLIIVDEEHDSSFKQHDPSPRYHARDVAVYMARHHGCGIVLGTATPSVESLYNAQEGRYAKVDLGSTFSPESGTHVHVCDIRQYERSGQMKTVLTPPLHEAIRWALAKKEQVILFHNRRGFAPYTECRQCGHVPHCVQCDVALIYHKQRQQLVCHYCGYHIQPPTTCAACGSNNLHYRGLGTERVEEDIEVIYSDAKIARMDLDTTRSRHAHRQLIDDFESGQIDILIGTQMVTKGLDFANVSVVGILNADQALNFPDFRSFERAFQLLTQVKGRAGRKYKGEVYIQTGQPNHPVIQHVVNGSSAAFYTEVMNERRAYFYPPFSRLIELSVHSRDVNEVNHLAQQLTESLKAAFGATVLGPEFAMIPRVKNMYRKNIVVKIDRHGAVAGVRNTIKEKINHLVAEHRKWNFRVNIDVDPA